nr:MAG TPA: hypothetical protein [Caudoviricetes sp.]
MLDCLLDYDMISEYVSHNDPAYLLHEMQKMKY